MAWNRSLPANATKLRLTPSILQANWDAIEFGQVPYDYLRLEKQGAAPARVANHGLVYSLNPGTGFTELYFRDDRNPSLQTQITNGGKIGTTSTILNAQSISFNGTFQNTQSAMCTAWSYVVIAANAISAQTNYGMSWTRTSTGLYKSTFTASQVTNSNYAIVGTAFSSSGGGEATILSFAADKTRDTSEFSIRIQKTDDSNSDRSFMVAVFGGR